ncbi:MAG: TM2 domain-containing protein [Clostridiales bacterium]|nr:TM2 domain-containing protein [Clostridiales bacterium]
MRLTSIFLSNGKYFPEEKIYLLKQKLLAADENALDRLSVIDLKDPTVSLIVSIFLGYLGIDRFLVGDIGLGILKLLTGGLCGIMAIVDWFLIMNRAKEINFNKVMLAL